MYMPTKDGRLFQGFDGTLFNIGLELEWALHGKKLATETEEKRQELREQLEKAYAYEFLNPFVAAENGYIDAIILGTLLPGSFTTKMEVKKIPILGQVVSLGDSIFIDRKKKANIVEYIAEMTDRLRNNVNVFNFPEGHATNGEKILPFFSAFFNAPLQVKAPIVPITIDYKKVNGNAEFDRDDIYCYDGKVSTIKHLWNLMKLKRIDVTVNIHEVVQPNGHAVNSKNRNLISNLCINRLSEYTNIPIAQDHPLQRSTSVKSGQ